MRLSTILFILASVFFWLLCFAVIKTDLFAWEMASLGLTAAGLAVGDWVPWK